MPPFPLQRTIRGAYADVFGQLGLLTRAGALWVMLQATLLVVAVALVSPGGAAGEVLQVKVPVLSPVTVVLALKWLAWLLGINAVAVVWHRRLILGEPGPVICAPVTGRVMAYVALTVTILVSTLALLWLGGYVLATMLAGPGRQPALPLSPPLLRLVVAVLLCFAMARLHLLLPAAAVGDRRMTLLRSWRLTGPHLFAIAGGMLACLIPVMLLGSVAELALSSVGGVGTLLGVLAGAALDVIQAAVFAAFLAQSYRFLQPRLPAAGSA